MYLCPSRVLFACFFLKYRFCKREKEKSWEKMRQEGTKGVTEILKESDKGMKEREEREKKKSKTCLVRNENGLNEKRQHGKSWRAQLISYCPFPWETSNKSVLVSNRKSFRILYKSILMTVVSFSTPVPWHGGRSCRSSQEPALHVHVQPFSTARKSPSSPQIVNPLSLTGTSGGWHLIP